MKETGVSLISLASGSEGKVNWRFSRFFLLAQPPYLHTHTQQAEQENSPPTHPPVLHLIKTPEDKKKTVEFCTLNYY